jgi:hypothetical protein
MDNDHFMECGPDTTLQFTFITKRPCAGTRTWRPSLTVPPLYKEKIMLKQVLICTAVVTMLMVNPVIPQLFGTSEGLAQQKERFY